LFDYLLDRGMRVHFSVKSIYKRGDDDGDDEQKVPDVLDIWTTADHCGYDFQIGETYLVYANNEEGADYYFTSACMRTKRLSDAGEDLGYLYFYKNQPGDSSRLEGFTTSDWKSQLAIDPMKEPAAIASPVGGVILQLQSNGFTRYAESDGNGRFVFDGLSNGTYQLSVFAAGYPETNQLLAGPRTMNIKAKDCEHQVFVLPKSGGR